jgi:hypothetical protein
MEDTMTQKTKVIGDPPSSKLAFSYVRCSSPEQIQGDSLRRQLEATQAYFDRNGLVLDQSLNL